MKVAILGAGSWGTALSIPISDNGYQVWLWTRSQARAEDIRRCRENARYLPGVRLPDNVYVTGEITEALDRAGLVIFAVPFKALRQVAEACKGLIKEVLVMSTAKGIGTGETITGTQILAQVLGASAHVCCLSGPNFAAEVSRRLPSATVVASRSPWIAEEVQSLLMTGRLRVYVSCDELGVQMGGALKNVVAIAVGMSDGLGLGHNARAGLITRGLAEMTRLGIVLGAEARTFAGLSGLGDLVLTCTGDYSRNRRLGLAVARGQSLKGFVEETGLLVEGAYTVSTARELSGRLGVEMPICEEVYQILFRGKPPLEGVNSLMWREKKHEYVGLT